MSDDDSTPAIAPNKKKPLALGRGLGALLGESRREEPLVNAAALAPAGPAPALPTRDGHHRCGTPAAGHASSRATAADRHL
ncbi:MAG: hypothetical protein ACK439_06110, partial [Novosphingobium sp.]